MISKPRGKSQTTAIPVIALVPQTGMPVIYPSRSKELAYDSLQSSSRFIFNPYGPRKLFVSRPNQHW